MATVTLLSLRTQARQRADMERTNFISDTELNNFINLSIAELHDLLLEGYGADYFTKSTDYSVTTPTGTFSLPADYLKTRGVFYVASDSSQYPIHRYNYYKKGRYTQARLARPFYFEYRVIGDNLTVQPNPDSGVTIRLDYIPTYTKLTADGDTLQGYNGWEDFVIVGAAIKCLIKEESDTAQLEREMVRIKRRLESVSHDRDASMPETITDVGDRDAYPYSSDNAWGPW